MHDISSLWNSAAMALAGMLVLTVMGWVCSLARHDASLADRIWPLFFALAATTATVVHLPLTTRGVCLLALVTAWALRLGVYITWRNWGHGEDRRYVQMRERHGKAFTWRSLYLVFGLQAVLAWVISAPLLTGIASRAPLTTVDMFGMALAVFGILFETVADAQLSTFKRDPAHRGQVMQGGLWAYSRHPNYFGEACTWWGFGLVACATGYYWTLLSPLLMTVLLLRVSGVSLLEQDITERRPAYREYMARTNAFIPGPRRSGTSRGRST
ncbi:DUF1295 domain-containing protein [Uliginosibacterium sp. H1]|uniref:DUF1295 domain-containing protein n=1 Tax=Uliginosibacterium sp. H1 TaxID=3114757 RepID=UPI002E18486B|nr:DUF1295 domain-containing protein [Uliginosibacterium sp. H1]